MALRIAYLINQYPMVSHSFIRREILALEQQGFDVLRISLQGWNAKVVDKEDQREQEKTRYVLQAGYAVLMWSVLRALIISPRSFYTALVLAVRMSRGAQRPLLYHLTYFAEACRTLSWVKQFGATHIHAHFGTNSAEVAMLVHTLGGPPYSFSVHGQDELLFGGIEEKVARAAFVVAISSYGRSQLFRRIEYANWHKIKVVHCGLEESFYNEVIITPPTALQLVCVGRLSKEKGQLLLVEAAYYLAKKGIDFELVLAGDGDMRKELEKLISLYGLSKQIRITGWLTGCQVREEILAARGLVLPSFTEGLPIVIMEAMSLHRPVLASCITGIPELVLQGVNGWLFPAGSVDDLAEAMEDCLKKSPEELRKMGDAGYCRVVERHSIDKEAAKLVELFHAQASSS